MNLIKLETIDSTNSYLKSNYKDLSHFTWITSEIQTHGRGRFHHTWIGSKDSLMSSILLKENISISNISLYPLFAAQSLHKVLSKYDTNLMIKWPNDIYLSDQKIAGILCESIIESNHVNAIIIGFGINLNQREFNSDLKDSATSLYLHTNQIYDKDVILNDLANQLEIDLPAYQQNPQLTIDYCNTYNYLKDLIISFTDSQQSYKGIALNINKDGQLNVEIDHDIIALNSGEVSLLKK